MNALERGWRFASKFACIALHRAEGVEPQRRTEDRGEGGRLGND